MSEGLVDRIKRHEGLRLKPYNCPAGHLTIGYGHNLEEGISERIAEELLREDIDKAYKDYRLFIPDNVQTKLNKRREEVIVEMIFNMGINKVLGFRKMLKAIEEKDFNRAAVEMLDSRWARQVGKRAIELAEIMREG